MVSWKVTLTYSTSTHGHKCGENRKRKTRTLNISTENQPLTSTFSANNLTLVSIPFLCARGLRALTEHELPAKSLASWICCSSEYFNCEAIQNACLQFPHFWNAARASSWAPHRARTEARNEISSFFKLKCPMCPCQVTYKIPVRL